MATQMAGGVAFQWWRGDLLLQFDSRSPSLPKASETHFLVHFFAKIALLAPPPPFPLRPMRRGQTLSVHGSVQQTEPLVKNKACGSWTLRTACGALPSNKGAWDVQHSCRSEWSHALVGGRGHRDRVGRRHTFLRRCTLITSHPHVSCARG